MSAMASQITSLTIVYSTVYPMRRSKKTSKLRVTGLCVGNSPVTGEFPAQRASNAENVSIWLRHHEQGSHTFTCEIHRKVYLHLEPTTALFTSSCQKSIYQRYSNLQFSTAIFTKRATRISTRKSSLKYLQTRIHCQDVTINKRVAVAMELATKQATLSALRACQRPASPQEPSPGQLPTISGQTNNGHEGTCGYCVWLCGS